MASQSWLDKAGRDLLPAVQLLSKVAEPHLKTLVFLSLLYNPLRVVPGLAGLVPFSPSVLLLPVPALLGAAALVFGGLAGPGPWPWFKLAPDESIQGILASYKNLTSYIKDELSLSTNHFQGYLAMLRGERVGNTQLASSSTSGRPCSVISTCTTWAAVAAVAYVCCAYHAQRRAVADQVTEYVSMANLVVAAEHAAVARGYGERLLGTVLPTAPMADGRSRAHGEGHLLGARRGEP